MAWSSAELSAAEIANAAANKPLIAYNAATFCVSSAKWTESATPGSGTDRTLTGYPARRAYDGHVAYLTKADTTSASAWYLYFAFSPAIEFDCCFLLGHNFGTLGLTTVELRISDNNNFSVNNQTLVDFGNPSDDSRIAALSLYHTGAVARRYSAVPYAGLYLGAGGNFTPQIREVIFGRRCQLSAKPDRPFDDFALEDVAVESESESGVIDADEKAVSRRRFDASWQLENSTEIASVETFLRARSRVFAYVPNPAAAPDTFNMLVREGGSKALPTADDSSLVRVLSLAAREQGPEAYYLENE